MATTTKRVRPKNVEQFLCNMLGRTGDRYVFGSEVPLTAIDPNGPWDCSELVEWAAFGLLPDGADNQRRRCEAAGTMISVATGMRTRGALLFVGDRSGTGRARTTHVAASLGDGTTVEARGRLYGVGCWAAAGRFQFAARIPGLAYNVRPSVPTPGPVAPRYPGTVLHQPPIMTGHGTRTAQLRLRDLGLYAGAIDDIYGPGTAKAVAAFQKRKGITKDHPELAGQLGPVTWRALWS